MSQATICHLDLVPAGAAAPAAAARVSHLFRASLSQGRLHPLYLPMLQYRAGQTPAAA